LPVEGEFRHLGGLVKRRSNSLQASRTRVGASPQVALNAVYAELAPPLSRFQQRAAAGLFLMMWLLCTNWGDVVTAVEAVLSRLSRCPARVLAARARRGKQSGGYEFRVMERQLVTGSMAGKAGAGKLTQRPALSLSRVAADLSPGAGV
jgi:hypothetical protein